MKVDRILDIIRRRRRTILITCALTLLVALLTFQPARNRHQIQMRFVVGSLPHDSTDEVEEERYFDWVSSEYEVAGISDWANGTIFANKISERLIAQGYEEMDVEEVDINMFAEFQRSMLRITVVYDDEETVKAMADELINIIESQEDLAIPQLSRANLQIHAIDEPFVTDFKPPVTEQLSLPLRLIIGLSSGFLLAAGLEFFDPTIRYREAVEDLDLAILGEIPGS